MFTAMLQAAKDLVGRTGPETAAQAPDPSKSPAPGGSPTPAWICGLDLGMMSDPSALAVVQKSVRTNAKGKRVNHYAVRHLQRWLGVDYPTIGEELRPMLASLKPAPTVAVDETGVGLGVLQIFRRLKLPVGALKGICITGGHRVSARAEGGFNVPKKELVAAGQSALQGRRLAISPALKDARTLAKELQTFKVKVSINATETYEAWREGDHDDLVLALCMAVWYGENHGQRLGPEHFFV